MPPSAATKCTSRGRPDSSCAPRSTKRTSLPAAGHALASFSTCPIPEIARLGRTLKQWQEPFLAYFATGRANNGGTEAVDRLIELHRRVAPGFRNRDNYRSRMLLIGGAFTDPRLA